LERAVRSRKDLTWIRRLNYNRFSFRVKDWFSRPRCLPGVLFQSYLFMVGWS